MSSFSLSWTLRSWSAGALLVALGAPPLRSQEAPRTDAVAALSSKIEEMEAEIKTLKSQLATVQATQAAAAATASAPEADESYPKLNFHGFGDINYTYSSQSQSFPNEFWLGELDLYVTAQLSPNISILSENVLSADSTFDTWNLEAERLIFDYKFNPYFNVAAGRFHTEIGYYNTQFHHGTWLQMDTHRPWFLNFEDDGGILPVHMVGLSIDGEIPSGGANLHYFAQVGNGRSYNGPTSPVEPTQADHVDNGRKAVNLEIISKPSGLPGVQFGLGVYHQVVSPQAVTPGQGADGFDVVPVPNALPSVRELIGNAFFVYSANGWNFLNEAFVISHTPSGGSAYNTVAGYTELSKQFGAWTPYARFTYVNSPSGDPVYHLIQTTGLRYGPTLGIRYDFTDFACFKIQYDHNDESNELEAAPTDALSLQIGFTF
ncbi:MAG TPA: hypothetical protein VGL42_12145 [Opitutaceae bacterium]